VQPFNDHTKNILNAIKVERQSNEEKIAVKEQLIELVMFKIGKTGYAFYGSDIKEILPYETIAFVPGCPEVILGIINVRGDIESVLNIHKILNKEQPTPTRHSRITIAEQNGIRSGILVDSVEDVVSIPRSKIFGSISTLDKDIRDFVDQITTYQGQYITILDIGKLFKTL